MPEPTPGARRRPRIHQLNGTSPRVILSFKATEDVQFNAQASRGFRLRGINDPINLPLCSRDRQGGVRQPAELAGREDLELRDRRQDPDGWTTASPSTSPPSTRTSRTCRRPRPPAPAPRAWCSTCRRPAASAGSSELFARPSANWDFGVSASYIDAKLTSSVTSTLPDGTTVVVGGLADGNRLPTAPKTAGGRERGLHAAGHGRQGLLRQPDGAIRRLSSFSQFENEEPGFGQIGGTGDPNAARLIPFGGPYSVSQINFAAELPSYTLANFRLGLKGVHWQAAACVNNFTDKTVPLALDYERGRSARVGYLVNQPRTYGIYGAYSF